MGDGITLEMADEIATWLGEGSVLIAWIPPHLLRLLGGGLIEPLA